MAEKRSSLGRLSRRFGVQERVDNIAYTAAKE
jgi:hypothetical protein